MLLVLALRMLWAKCGMRLCELPVDTRRLLVLLFLCKLVCGEVVCGSDSHSSESPSSHGSPIFDDYSARVSEETSSSSCYCMIINEQELQYTRDECAKSCPENDVWHASASALYNMTRQSYRCCAFAEKGLVHPHSACTETWLLPCGNAAAGISNGTTSKCMGLGYRSHESASSLEKEVKIYISLS